MNDRLSTGEKLAGVAGLALILIMFLFAWYGVGLPGVSGLDAFDAFDDWVDIILVFTAFAGMSLGLFGDGVARIPISLSVLTAVLGGISSIVLVVYIISPPGVPTFGEAAIEVSLGREPGVWLGLIAAVSVGIGGYLTMQEGGISFGDAADRLSGGAGSGPSAGPPAPPPPPPPPPPAPPSAG